jgi:C-terminal processing protease CtpA/Prc
MKTTKRFLPICILFLFLANCNQSNNTKSQLNLGFEDIQDGIPRGLLYAALPDYSVSLDSVIRKSGKYSISIEFTGTSNDLTNDSDNSQTIFFVLPDYYKGEKITLSGYIKTENITDGYAGLWMKIDPQIAFDKMQQKGVVGTTGWKKYEITLDLDSTKIPQIIFGGYLTGNGKMWLDDLKISIDGKDFEKLKPDQLKLFSEKAKSDHEFDQGSNIIFPELTAQKIDDLELLGRIWGFLKYHHPDVAKGNYNWDYELFRILPAYLAANDNQQKNNLLLKWINKFGEIPESKGYVTITSDSSFLKPDLSWIEKSSINVDLKNLLQKIYLNRYQGSQYYIQMNQTAGNPVFSNESTYKEMNFPDTGFRLLALYRYWNMIHYFFPYKHLTDKDWNGILKEYIPYFVQAKNRLEYELTTTLLIGEVCDTHAGLWEGGREIDSLRGDKQIPVQVQFIENKWVVTDYYMSPAKVERAELKIGDIITHVDGKSVESIVDSIKKYYPASNEAARMRNIARDLLRSNEHTLYINYISSNQLKQNKIHLEKRSDLYHYIYKKDTTKCYKFINENIGYISLKTIKDEDIKKIKEDFRNTHGIIIDIRNYPSTFVPFTLGSYFVLDSTPFVKFTNRNINNPGEFTFSQALEIPKSKETYQGKLVVIVNEITQSQAEYTAMALRAGDNTTIIGSQTAGADGNVSKITLPGGLKTQISGIGVYYPDGRETQRIGIVPDIEVKPTIKGIREGRDELLEKAIEIIEQDQNSD